MHLQDEADGHQVSYVAKMFVGQSILTAGGTSTLDLDLGYGSCRASAQTPETPHV